eukprot:gene1885-3655_t
MKFSSAYFAITAHLAVVTYSFSTQRFANRAYQIRMGKVNNNKVEDGVDLSSLCNFLEDSAFLSESVRTWLDKEYIPQHVHTNIGERVGEIYIYERSKGTNDLGQMLVSVGTALENFDMNDAFVNGWEVANKVSDLLLLRMNRELCACAGDMSGFSSLSSGTTRASGQITAEKLKSTTDRFKSTFSRYIFLREFLEGEEDATWEDAEAAAAVVMGFRAEGGTVVHKKEFSPYGWDTVYSIPPLSNYKDVTVTQRFEEDLPNEEAMDILLESVAGVEGFKVLKLQEDEETLRKLLVVKWLYVNGFLIDDFPSSNRFIPGHVDVDVDVSKLIPQRTQTQSTTNIQIKYKPIRLEPSQPLVIHFKHIPSQTSIENFPAFAAPKIFTAGSIHPIINPHQNSTEDLNHSDDSSPNSDGCGNMEALTLSLIKTRHTNSQSSSHFCRHRPDKGKMTFNVHLRPKTNTMVVDVEHDHRHGDRKDRILLGKKGFHIWLQEGGKEQKVGLWIGAGLEIRSWPDRIKRRAYAAVSEHWKPHTIHILHDNIPYSSPKPTTLTKQLWQQSSASITTTLTFPILIGGNRNRTVTSGHSIPPPTIYSPTPTTSTHLPTPLRPHQTKPNQNKPNQQTKPNQTAPSSTTSPTNKPYTLQSSYPNHHLPPSHLHPTSALHNLPFLHHTVGSYAPHTRHKLQVSFTFRPRIANFHRLMVLPKIHATKQ